MLSYFDFFYIKLYLSALLEQQMQIFNGKCAKLCSSTSKSFYDFDSLLIATAYN